MLALETQGRGWKGLGHAPTALGSGPFVDELVISDPTDIMTNPSGSFAGSNRCSYQALEEEDVHRG